MPQSIYESPRTPNATHRHKRPHKRQFRLVKYVVERPKSLKRPKIQVQLDSNFPWTADRKSNDPIDLNYQEYSETHLCFFYLFCL